MPSITYFIRFTLRDPNSDALYELQEYLHLTDAFKAFRLFAEEDSRWMYTSIVLSEHNWEEGTETHIASLSFSV